MRIKLLAFGIARDILDTRSMAYDMPGNAHTVGELKAELCTRFEDFGKLRKLSFAVNENYVDDDYALSEGDEVVLIPPVSGG